MTIFVLHHAKDDVTNACLASLIDQGPILVIDNGSPIPFVPAHGNITVMRNEQNLHLIDAFNRAMQAHPDDWYLAVTNDTKASPGMVDKLLAALHDPAIGIVSGGTNDRGAGALYAPHPGDWPSIDMPHVDNTIWGWPHDLVEAIGWPDCAGHTHIGCWGSNQDYCYRARRAGYRVVGVRSAYYWHAHDGGQDVEAWQAGRDWLQQKWGDKAPEVWA